LENVGTLFTTAAGMQNTGSAGSTAPRKFQMKNGPARKFECKNRSVRKFEKRIQEVENPIQ
jgi:hypothetical protein